MLPTSEVGPISEVAACNCHVRFTPIGDQTADIARGPFRANSSGGVRRHVTNVRAWANSLFSMSVIAIVGELGIMHPAIRAQGATEANGKWRKN
jgi:hypothetical protein